MNSNIFTPARASAKPLNSFSIHPRPAKKAPTPAVLLACIRLKSAFEIGHAIELEPNVIVTFTSVSQAGGGGRGGDG